MEISESSLAVDREEMASVYAASGIEIYWILNLVDRQVEVYSDPQPEGYRTKQVFIAGEDVPVFVAGVEVGRIMVAELLP